MRNNWEQHDGILLQTIPYLETSRILKIFTPTAGLLTLISRGKKAEIPFGRAEWTISKTRGELYLLRETSLLNPFLDLRSSYEVLSGAGSIARALLHSQVPNKPSPTLYTLLLACFGHLKKNPSAVAQSFRLKLLHYEGVIRIDPMCSRCDAPASLLSGGESVCSKHASLQGSLFEQKEWETLLILSSSRRFSDLEPLQIAPEFSNKLEQFFCQTVC